MPQHDRVIGRRQRQTELPGTAGVDLHYTLGNNLNLEMDYGQQLRRAPGYTSRGGEFDISLTVSF